MSRQRHEAALTANDAVWDVTVGAAAACARQWAAEARALRDENARLRKAVALHQPDEAEVGWQLCLECEAPWPCSTARAAGLDGEERQ